MTIDFGDHMVTARKFTHRNAAQCNALALHCILCCIVNVHSPNPRACKHAETAVSTHRQPLGSHLAN